MENRLVIVAPSHSIRGGAVTVITDLCRELPSHGWETILALAQGSQFHDVRRFQRVHPDLPIVAVDGTAGTRQGRLEGLSRTIRYLEPDVVLSSRIVDAYEVGVRLKQEGRLQRFATTIRGFEPAYLYDLRNYGKAVDLCVTCGEMIAASAVHLGELESNRVVNIPPGVKKPLRSIGPREQRKELRLGYVGRLSHSDKRVLEVIPLIRELRRRGLSFNLSIVGTGPDESNLRARVRSAGFGDVVQFRGWRSQRELYEDVYPALDCVLLFSPFEGVTIAPREAMVHGAVPVIAKFAGLEAEGQFKDEKNALVFPVGDHRAAGAAIHRLSTEPDLLHRLSVNALKSQTGKYTYEGAIRCWARSFERCLEMPKKSASVQPLDWPPDGRLARLGFPPRLAQRIRDLLSLRHRHADPGGEWPHASRLMAEDFEERARQFVENFESCSL